MPQERSATEARQGQSGTRVFVILLVSTLAAATLAIAAYIYVFAADNEEIAEEPVPVVGPVDEAQ